MKKILVLFSGLTFCVFTGFAADRIIDKQTTEVIVKIPENLLIIDPMIYGQMLEDCNDKVIYGGLFNEKNEENKTVFNLLKPLQMPVVRWPAGTYIHEYDWENGIGPKEKRPSIACIRWGGYDSNLFGTDEFLQWCQRVGTVPYINFNMSNHPEYAASLGDALNWIEYVNGSEETAFGMKRIANGHAEPYGVKYWCLGNENYGSYGIHKAETADFYSGKLYQWASCIKTLHPDLSLLAVGHLYDWNKKVLAKNGKLIDFLTIHFYMGAKLKDNLVQDPVYTLFAPLKTEMQIQKNVPLLDEINERFQRTDHPIRFSIDEWNCRHLVFANAKYSFTRNDDRRLFDIVATAGMLNVFIRQSPHVGMANYIFPVNGHGLIRTVGDDDAYKSTIYYVFDFYRKYMAGVKLDVSIKGSTVALPTNRLAIEGAFDNALLPEETIATFVDVTAVMPDESTINISLINRSPDSTQKIKLKIPEGFIPIERWVLEHKDINAANTSENRENIIPQRRTLSQKELSSGITVLPCGFTLIRCQKADNP